MAVRREYTRRTIIAAGEMLKALGHSGLDKFALELGDQLELISGRDQGGLDARATSISKFALRHQDALTPHGTYISNEIVERAKDLWAQGTLNNISARERSALATALASENDPLLNDPLESPTAYLAEANPFKAAVERPSLFETTSTRTPFDKAARVSGALSPLFAKIEGSAQTNATSGQPAKKEAMPRKVFIVHGHGRVEADVARFLERISFEAIILHEKINKGQTIIEKFEHHADVPYAVVLVTPDDVGGKTAADLRNRARQNVILEWGYFAGKLGRGKVCVIKVGDTELPSDLLGVAWYSYESDPWKNRLAQELETAGFSIDWAAVSRAT